MRDLAAAAEGYRARFGCRTLSPPIHDPLQTAIVQFLELAPGQTMLELVSPDSDASKLSGMVRQGGGLHHLCYTAELLEPAIAALSATGLRLIGDPSPASAFAGRRICWLLGPDRSLIELIERRDDEDSCPPAAVGEAG